MSYVHVHHLEPTGEVMFRADGTFMLYACDTCSYKEWRRVETDWGENNGFV